MQHPFREKTMMRFLVHGFGPALVLAACVAWAELPENAVWIDVRTPGEYAEGHLAGARQIPFDGIEAGINKLDLAKDTPIFLYCGSGGRSEVAKQALERKGYTQVNNVGGLGDALELTGQKTPTKPNP